MSCETGRVGRVVVGVRVEGRWLAYAYVDNGMHTDINHDDQKEDLYFAYTRSRLLGNAGSQSN